MGVWAARSCRLCSEVGSRDVSTHQAWPRACRWRRVWSISMSDSSTVLEYTPAEMMIVVAARALAGVRTVFVGVGLPNIACNVARYTVAPDLELIYESGVYGAQP